MFFCFSGHPCHRSVGVLGTTSHLGSNPVPQSGTAIGGTRCKPSTPWHVRTSDLNLINLNKFIYSHHESQTLTPMNTLIYKAA